MGSDTVVGVSNTRMSTIKSASTLSLTKIHKVKNFKNAPGTTTCIQYIYILLERMELYQCCLLSVRPLIAGFCDLYKGKT